MRVPVSGVPVMRSYRLPLLPVLACMLMMPTMASAGPTVYRCETAGKVAYSDSPCIGATIVDATPTQGMARGTSN